MKTPAFATLALFFSILSLASCTSVPVNFLQCLRFRSDPSIPVYTPSTPTYSSALQFSIRNPRFNSTTAPKPQTIVQPLNPTHVQAAVLCARMYGLHLRIRSGGHDYEGLSYTSVSPTDVPFVILDLINMASIDVDVANGTAWVQTGATLGQVYYRIAEKSNTYGFPAGFCPSVGSGGHISGGGYGTLLRMYGLAADNTIDARLVNVDGKILNRKSMGEDLFWAIRGGGAASFGVVIAWKIRLVPVPPTVTIFRADRTLEQGASSLVDRWQYVAPNLPRQLFIRIIVDVVNSTRVGERTIRASFQALFLGRADNLISIMDRQFPELGVKREICNEMRWIQSTLFIAGFPTDGPLDVLLNRIPQGIVFFKSNADYFTEPISRTGLEGIWKLMLAEDMPQMFFVPYGGRMSEISESSIPFPHRKGNLYKISPFSFWTEEGPAASTRHINYIRKLYRYLTPYVSKSPRSAYINYREIDLGRSRNGTASYSESKAWGIPYFNNNYDRLVKVKSKVDPSNFFRNEQSIPTWSGRLSEEDNDLSASI